MQSHIMYYALPHGEKLKCLTRKGNTTSELGHMVHFHPNRYHAVPPLFQLLML